MSLKKKISLILNILIVICGVVIFVLSIIKHDIPTIRNMWSGIIVGYAISALYETVFNKENRNG